MDEAQRSEWKIVALTIEGFRRFQRRHTWEFRAPDGSPLDVILFAGPSGSGKTSALEALLIALGEQASAAMAGACVTLVLERWRMAGQDYEDIEARREVIWRGEAKQPVFFRDKAVDYFSSWRAPERVGGVKPKTKGAPKKKSEANRLFLIKEHIVSSLARSAIVKGSPSSAGQDALNMLNMLWARFAPASFSARAKIEAGEAVKSNDGYDLFVVDGDRRISVDDLSAGELELLQLAGSFAFGLAAPRALLIVDEPELHLDQALQSAWLDVVREATGCATQLILATHSEEIWSRAYSYERFLLVDAQDPRAQLHAARGGIRS